MVAPPVRVSAPQKTRLSDCTPCQGRGCVTVAQQLVYDITNNPLVKEHVIWQLPDRNQVQNWVEKAGFEVCLKPHTSLAQWISQYLLQTAAPDIASRANHFLLEHHLEEPVGTPLYDLTIGRRTDR